MNKKQFQKIIKELNQNQHIQHLYVNFNSCIFGGTIELKWIGCLVGKHIKKINRSNWEDELSLKQRSQELLEKYQKWFDEIMKSEDTCK